jgi:hypothetical protein
MFLHEKAHNLGAPISSVIRITDEIYQNNQTYQNVCAFQSDLPQLCAFY